MKSFEQGPVHSNSVFSDDYHWEWEELVGGKGSTWALQSACPHLAFSGTTTCLAVDPGKPPKVL
jgi:hypothetical protein